MRFGAIIGAATVSTLAVAPAFAAAATSQATAQSLHISIAGTDAISQKVTASNNGTTETKNNADTLPTIASVFPGTNLLGAGVAPQEAAAKKDGTSYACAGIAGTGGGIVTVGNSSCDLDGQPLTINLGGLDLGNVVLGDGSALGAALNGLPIIGDVLTLLGQTLNQLVTTISDGLAGTPLGQISLGGSLSAIEGSCVADPEKATGDARLVDSSGGSNATPIGVTIPTGVGNGTQTLTLLNLPANPPPNTHVLVDLDTVTQTLVTALTTELNTAVGGVLAPLNLGVLLQQVQDAVVTQLVANLQPLLTALQDNILDITLNKQSTGDGGRSIHVTALDAQVLPAAAQFAGASLISGQIGDVTCGPNTRASAAGGETPDSPQNPDQPDVPTVVDSGVAGQADHTARNVLGATAALMLLAGTAGLVGYRRMLNK
jgi:hypothetical protein